MRRLSCLFFLSWLLLGTTTLHAQTADDITKLMARLVELDSIDLTPGLKFRPGLEPSLFALDADESGMKSLENPYEVHGQGKPGAAGWYRVSFVVPEQIGKFKFKQYNLGIETNVLGSWEIYVYNNGKPAGLWSKDGMKKSADQQPSYWMSNAPMPTKPGDKITVAVLAMASPLGRGSDEGYGLRHFRLRFALRHTAARQPFYGQITGPGQGTGLHGVREKLRTLQGDDLAKFQAKIKEPLARLDLVFAAAETGELDKLTEAMFVAAKEIDAALKK